MRPISSRSGFDFHEQRIEDKNCREEWEALCTRSYSQCRGFPASMCSYHLLIDSASPPITGPAAGGLGFAMDEC
jgi:hypothetical protein